MSTWGPRGVMFHARPGEACEPCDDGKGLAPGQNYRVCCMSSTATEGTIMKNDDYEIDDDVQAVLDAIDARNWQLAEKLISDMEQAGGRETETGLVRATMNGVKVKLGVPVKPRAGSEVAKARRALTRGEIETFARLNIDPHVVHAARDAYPDPRLNDFERLSIQRTNAWERNPRMHITAEEFIASKRRQAQYSRRAA